MKRLLLAAAVFSAGATVLPSIAFADSYTPFGRSCEPGYKYHNPGNYCESVAWTPTKQDGKARTKGERFNPESGKTSTQDISITRAPALRAGSAEHAPGTAPRDVTCRTDPCPGGIADQGVSGGSISYQRFQPTPTGGAIQHPTDEGVAGGGPEFAGAISTSRSNIKHPSIAGGAGQPVTQPGAMRAGGAGQPVTRPSVQSAREAARRTAPQAPFDNAGAEFGDDGADPR